MLFAVALFVMGAAAFGVPPHPGWRLIRTNQSAAAQWHSPGQVADLVRARQPGAGLGFMDITHVVPHAQKQQRKRKFPAKPTRMTEVRAMFRQYLEPEGPSHLFNFLRPLTEFHNRYYTGEWAVASSQWIAEEAQRIINASGRPRDASVRLHLNPDFPQMNIVAKLRGSDPTKKDILVLGAHMDSINSQGDEAGWPYARAPGADDDGTGSAVLLYVLDTLLRGGYTPERTIEFQWYAGEERGLLGSRVLANEYRRQGVEVYAMMQIDMCGGGGDVNFVMDYVSRPLSEFVMKLVGEYMEHGVAREFECGYGCSDHASWHDEGYPSSFPIESRGTRDPDTGEPCRGHSEDDRLVCVDPKYMLDFARLAVAYALELSPV